MDALGDLVTRERRSDHPTLVASGAGRRYDYRRFCTTAWKTGNFWRRIGVHADATVAVAADRQPEAVFSFLGAALLGARTRFEPPGARAAARAPGRDSDSDSDPGPDARVVVAHCDEIDQYEVAPGSKRVAYGGPPGDPSVAHFERDVWSENPAFPDTPVDPGAVALVARACDERDRADSGTGNSPRQFSHADLLTAARRLADDWDLGPGDEVAVHASLARPGAVVAGVLAPLLAGAAILFPDGDATGDFAVVAGHDGDSAPESRSLAASSVL
ncbi:acyl-CoA synthetase family protein [Halorussus litoreus]|uniref:hypothetical protein n=1 Tax=Halorussus litoreus TaxID=1710536 RepID=UPI0018E4E6F6|nr:hypothetical protein [Halorussus litoreus]